MCFDFSQCDRFLPTAKSFLMQRRFSEINVSINQLFVCFLLQNLHFYNLQNRGEKV